MIHRWIREYVRPPSPGAHGNCHSPRTGSRRYPRFTIGIAVTFWSVRPPAVGRSIRYWLTAVTVRGLAARGTARQTTRRERISRLASLTVGPVGRRGPTRFARGTAARRLAMRWEGFEPSRDVPGRSLQSLPGLRLAGFEPSAHSHGYSRSFEPASVSHGSLRSPFDSPRRLASLGVSLCEGRDSNPRTSTGADLKSAAFVRTRPPSRASQVFDGSSYTDFGRPPHDGAQYTEAQACNLLRGNQVVLDCGIERIESKRAPSAPSTAARGPRDGSAVPYEAVKLPRRPLARLETTPSPRCPELAVVRESDALS